MIKLIILGAAGSMGRLISKLALEDEEIEVVAACDVNNIGDLLETLVGAKDPKNIKITDIKNLQEIINQTKPDVAVDFSIAKATENNCVICVNNRIRCVIGTTGMSEEFYQEFEKLVIQHKTPAVVSSNMATGVNIFFKMAAILTKYLSDWDIEIIEAHHHRKIDSPSGTALTTAKIIAETLNASLDDIAKFGRDKGPNKRKVGAKNEIGIHAIRAGDIVGDHIVLYAGPGERIELKHQVHSRTCLANGAITAVKFIEKAPENKVYNTQEVLGI